MLSNDIVVVGGGAAGSAVFGELLLRDDGGTVHWIAAHTDRGRGVAYATESALHLLNVRADGMGLFRCHEEEFAQFAARGDAAVRTTDFLPRRLFGDFIQAQLEARMAEARRVGRRFVMYDDAACAIDVDADGGYVVRLGSRGTVDARAVVLAIGALPARPLRTVSDVALGSGAYILDPWNLDPTTPPPQRVLVIGTGLTAVDTLLSASTRWPRAELIAVSRHGQLPLPHAPLPSAPWPQQESLNTTLLDCDRVLPMLGRIRAAIATASNCDWRSVIDGMRPINARLWQNLSSTERRRFLRHLRWAWEASRHRTAPGSAQAIEELRRAGRLNVHAARVLSVDGTGPLEVAVRQRGTGKRDTLQADLVLQATGLDTAAAYTQHPVLSYLLANGLVQADPLQLGIAALPNGRIVHAGAQVQEGLYGIGWLLRGCLWECTAMPEIRAAAHALATTLVPGADSDIRNGTEDR